MIHYQDRPDGSVVFWISRCNDFGDHKTPEMRDIGRHRLLDGDINLGVIEKDASLDAAHAKVLIDRIRERLRDARRYQRLKRLRKKQARRFDK